LVKPADITWEILEAEIARLRGQMTAGAWLRRDDPADADFAAAVAEA
jgi:hypothetical protein